jgi:hypothetical protein
MARFSGKRPVRAYARWFGVDLECAVAELQLLGVALDPAYLQALRATCEGQRRAKAAAAQSASLSDIGWAGDERFAFIAGRTAAGFAYGVTWEEMAALEAEEREARWPETPQPDESAKLTA